MKKNARKLPFVLAAVFAFNALRMDAFGAETFDYPELLVTPRASDRLELEARKEQESRWFTHLTLQVPALATLAAGIAQDVDRTKDPDNRSSLAGVVVGGGWLALTLALNLAEGPYSAAHREVSPMPKKSVREQLTRERFAEEAIRKQAGLSERLRWLSVATNAGASVYLLAKAKDNTFSKVLDAVSLAVAFTPVVFAHPWRDVAREQADYKKRIYGPVAGAAILAEPGTERLVPGVQLSLRF
ncbi:MAG: hypothetical protein NDJ89_14110 [Oligoflexia bacterium]|nr:hypothetical protein [Oligoflexia bacterium]